MQQITFIFMSYRFGRPALFSIINPDFPDSKTDILDPVFPDYREFLPLYYRYVRSAHTTGEEMGSVLRGLGEAGLEFPIVAKPDNGLKGLYVKLLSDADALENYLRRVDNSITLHFQQLVDMPYEAGVFYIRHPELSQGRIVSLSLKAAPCAVGDGLSTVRQLIENSGKPRYIRETLLKKNSLRLDQILAKDERLVLSFSRNFDQGGIYRDITTRITRELTEIIDRISQKIPGFFYGRFDVKFQSMEDFLKGKSFKILEVNSYSSADGRLYSESARFLSGISTIIKMNREMLRIAAANRARGYKMKSPRDLWKGRSVVRDFIKKAQSFDP
ncbi:MAG: hypothetical protein LJE70_05365 [Chromatiaceae bacterium]|nr:hypothetical protein [Chromatiaceae bacterium]